MKHPEKPVIVPSAVSLGGVLWGGVLVVYFLAALAVYSCWGRLEAVRAQLAEPVEMPIGNAYFSTTVPAGWRCYEEGTNCVTCYRGDPQTLPMIVVATYRDAANAYRALDRNPALVARQISALFDPSALGVRHVVLPQVVDVEFENVQPGTSAVKAFFILPKSSGLSYVFYRGDIRYLVVGIWPNDDTAGRDDVCSRVEHIFDRFEFPPVTEHFTRPAVNSANQAAGEHVRVLKIVARERALWKMFADRVETEPEAALMPAIGHFRKSLELLSSLREERQLLESEDFQRYNAFLARRAALVREWFVLLDKYRAMGDREATRRQAEFILRRATLEEETLDRRRAGACLAELNAEEGNG